MKKISSSSSQDQQQTVALQEQIHQSSYVQHYLNEITLIKKNSQQFNKILIQLKDNSIEYSEKFSFQFKKKIVKSSKDSIKYQIQYGNFMAFISASFALFDLQRIPRQEINRGQFGKILSFKYNGQLIIAKQFSSDKNLENINRILKEVFFAKFASILKIGPKFIKAYGYDLIYLKGNKSEFLMQKCCSMGESKQMFQSLVKIRMHTKYILSILHSFHAIHGDIKFSHIVWSPKQKRIVMLDFGLTRFIKEKVGQMTMTLFFGTFCYSCQQMKKAYYLKSPVLVDLYYNDLYAFGLCDTAFSQQFQAKFKKIVKYRGKKLQNWEQVATIFNFKFLIFEENIEQAKKIFKREKQLADCFWQIIKFQQIKSFAIEGWDSLKKQIRSTFSEGFSQINNQKQTIYIELLKFNEKPVFCNFCISKNWIKEMYHNGQLSNFLQSKGAMEALFQFLFKEKQLTPLETKQIKKIIKYIFLFIHPTFSKQQLNYSLMIRQVLVIFQKYFYRQGNLNKLQNIEFIFKFTHQIRYLKKVQQNICEVFLKNIDLWFEDYSKNIVALLNSDQNPRNFWVWLTTQPVIRKQFLSEKDEQLISQCANIIKAAHRKISYECLNLKYVQDQLQKSLISYSLQLYKKYKQEAQCLKITREQSFMIGGLEIHKKPLEKIEQWIEGTFTYTKSRLKFLNFIFQESVWSLSFEAKVKSVNECQKFLEYYFQNVFAPDTFEGIIIFVKFRYFLINLAKKSKKAQHLMQQFLTKIEIRKILSQIKDDTFSLKKIVLGYFQLPNIFMRKQFQTKIVNQHLDQIYKQIKCFFAQISDQKQKKQRQQLIILLKTGQIYLYAKKNSFKQYQQTFIIKQAYMKAGRFQIQQINKMIEILQTIIQKKYSKQTFQFVFTLISLKIAFNSCLQSCIDPVWKLLKMIEDQQFLFKMLINNMNLFQSLVNRLIQTNQFQQCLKLLEDYGKAIQIGRGYLNKLFLNVYSNFIQILPDKIATSMFIHKLSQYKLERVSKSPYLSFVFYFVFQKQQQYLNFEKKFRLIKIISFGLKKISLRYQKYAQINAYLLKIYRQNIIQKSERKKLIDLQQEARVSHSQKLLEKVTIKRKKYFKSSISLNKESIKFFLFKKFLQKLKNINDLEVYTFK